MITNKLLSGQGPLLAKKVVLPIDKMPNGVYRLFSSDYPINIEINWSDLAVPQGYGRYVGNYYLFRRVDCLWIIIHDPELARIVNKAIKHFCNGEPVTFGELAIECSSENTLKVAYVTKILGNHSFSKKEEEEKKYKITHGWTKRVKDFNAYYSGLSLFEKYSSKIYCSLPTFWHDQRIELGKNVTEKGGVLYAAGSPIEDPLVLEFLECYSGEKIEDIIQEFSLIELRILSLLLGAGILDFAQNSSTSKIKVCKEKKSTLEQPFQ